MTTKTETALTGLTINYLSESDYNTALSNGEINENEIYMTPFSNSSSEVQISNSGNGNAVTAITSSGNTLTVTKGSTFLTSHPSVSTSSDSTSKTSPSHGGTFTAIDSVTRDSNGHVTKVNTKTITLPTDNNTDTKVNQSSSTASGSYPILASASTSPTSGSANTAIYNTGLTLNPSTKTITATTFSGTATKATQDSAGNQINTTYIKGLSVSGKTITYTKGNGSTGTITTQDTTYSDATTSISGLLSYSSNVGTVSEVKSYVGY